MHCSCRAFTRSLGPLEATSTITSSTCSSSMSPSPSGRRRYRRVLYPASQRRVRLPREAPDQACRWLLLLSTLVFLQIYTEEVHPCTELQKHSTDSTVSTRLQVDEESLCTSQRWTGEESWRVQIEGSAGV